MMNSVNRGVRCALLLTLAGTVASCATSAPGVPDGGASGAELSHTFGACSQGELGDAPEPLEYLASLTPWRQVTAISDTSPYDDPHLTELVTTTFSDSTGDDRTALLSAPQLAGVRWALAHDADAWLGVQPPGTQEYEYERAGTAMVLTADDVFFAGDCSDEFLYAPVHGALGDEAPAVMRELADASPAEAQALLGLDAPQQRPTQEPIILNPETAPADLLATLRVVSIHLEASGAGPLDDTTTICTHIAEGWSDCVPSDRARDGVNFNGYVGEDGVLEFWLLDGNGTVTAPLGFLGSIVVSDSENPVAKVTLDAQQLEPSSLPKIPSSGADGLVHLRTD